VSSNTDNWTGNLSGKKLAAASLLVGIVSLLTFTLMLVGALSGIGLGLAALMFLPFSLVLVIIIVPGFLMDISERPKP